MKSKFTLRIRIESCYFLSLEYSNSKYYDCNDCLTYRFVKVSTHSFIMKDFHSFG